MANKNIYYYINESDQKVIVRISENDYKYALIFKDAINNQKAIRCSSKLEIVQQEFKYRTKGFGHKFNEKVNGKYLYSSQFMDPNKLQIVELLKECD